MPAARYAAKTSGVQRPGSGFISTDASAKPLGAKRSRSMSARPATVAASYVFGVPPPKNSVRAGKAGAAAISACRASKYRAALERRSGHFAKSQYGQTYGQNGRWT